jgi:hypothetical protein
MRRACATVVLLVSVGACGDIATRDDRGYTKAPLETPGLRIGAEEPSPMRELGDPILPEARELEAAAADSVSATTM